MIEVTFTTRAERVLGFDLESMPSAFWYGDKTTAQITAIGWKWVDEPGVHSMLLQPNGWFLGTAGNEIDPDFAYSYFAGLLSEADLVFGHNIRGFDLPLFQSGLQRRNLPKLPQLRTTDTLKDYPKRKDMSASLENLAKQHGIDDQGGKKHMSVVDWEDANQLTPEGVIQARERVVSDVLLQEKLRARLGELGYLRPPRAWNP